MSILKQSVKIQLESTFVLYNTDGIVNVVCIFKFFAPSEAENCAPQTCKTLITPVDKSKRKYKFLLSEKLNLAKHLGQFLPKKICTSTKNDLNYPPWKSQF